MSVHLFVLFQCVYIILEALSDKSFGSFKEQNQLTFLTAKYDWSLPIVFL